MSIGSRAIPICLGGTLEREAARKRTLADHPSKAQLIAEQYRRSGWEEEASAGQLLGYACSFMS